MNKQFRDAPEYYLYCVIENHVSTITVSFKTSEMVKQIQVQVKTNIFLSSDLISITRFFIDTETHMWREWHSW